MDLRQKKLSHRVVGESYNKKEAGCVHQGCSLFMLSLELLIIGEHNSKLSTNILLRTQANTPL